jgi:ketosteroid isomerase-like protein
MLSICMPTDIPHEASESDVKVAAADAAQATANAAQDVANDCRKEADDALAADPMAPTQKIDLREACSEATQSIIHMLRKINQPKQ